MKQYTEENPLKVFTAFSGYDSTCLALNRTKIPYELVGWSETDKYAIKSHDALFPQWSERNYGDIKEIDWAMVPDFDMFSYSSIDDDCMKAIREKKPKFLILENIKGLLYDTLRPSLNKWLNELEELGYVNFYDVLNAKDFGVPQNRERLYVVSILKTEDEKHPYFEFPKPYEEEKQPWEIAGNGKLIVPEGALFAADEGNKLW